MIWVLKKYAFAIKYKIPDTSSIKHCSRSLGRRVQNFRHITFRWREGVTCLFVNSFFLFSRLTKRCIIK